MTNFLLFLIFGTFFTFGIFCIFSEGYILGKMGTWLQKQLPSWIYKPLIGCPPCMASIYGSILGVTVYDFTFIAFAFIICLCGLNFIIKSIIYPEYED